ncbi:MAG: DUF3347 domain-containing protein [Bacteroidota bacterium]
MRHISIFTVLISLSIISCNNVNPTANTTEKKAENLQPQSKLSGSGTQKLMTVVSTYYGLKDALVSSDGIKADSSVNKLLPAIDSFKAFLITDTANRTVFLPYMDTMILESKILLSMDPKNYDGKRAPFERISDQMYAVLKKADLKHAGVYREFCPMAFNDKGAFWLSNDAEIKNPYFGKKMLECGEVTDSLK